MYIEILNNKIQAHTHTHTQTQTQTLTPNLKNYKGAKTLYLILSNSEFEIRGLHCLFVCLYTVSIITTIKSLSAEICLVKV